MPGEALHVVPQRNPGSAAPQRSLKDRATALLDLVHEEDQHHHAGQRHGQPLISMAEIMRQIVILPLHRQEQIVLDAPASPASPHQGHQHEFVDAEIGIPCAGLGSTS